LRDSGNAVHERHGDVHHDDIRRSFPGQHNRLTAIFSLADNFDVSFRRQQGAQPLPNHGVIVHQQNCNFFHKCQSLL